MGQAKRARKAKKSAPKKSAPKNAPKNAPKPNFSVIAKAMAKGYAKRAAIQAEAEAKDRKRAQLVARAKKKLEEKEWARAAAKRGPVIMPKNYDEVVAQHAKLATVPYRQLRRDERSFLLGYTRRDQSVAKHFSSLRHLKEASRLIRRLEEFQGDAVAFAEEAHAIADEYGVDDVAEVFTLFWSH